MNRLEKAYLDIKHTADHLSDRSLLAYWNSEGGFHKEELNRHIAAMKEAISEYENARLQIDIAQLDEGGESNE